MNNTIFETQRLIVRTATVDDVDLYYHLWTDPRVMAMVGFPRGMRISRDEIMERLIKQPGDEFGRLLVIELKNTGQPIGECWLGNPGGNAIVEPDVKLLPAFWGNHYGVEVWKELVNYIFNHTEFEIIQATPNVENIASIKMQVAAGAVWVGEDTGQFPEAMRQDTTPVHYYIYQIQRADWQWKIEHATRIEP
ncbi:MAG: GNAT family N-acetyltransferase [Omnitrophica WOR_2 bacterium]